jgi:Cu+-exporting ATPase
MATRAEAGEYTESEDLALQVRDPVCGRDVVITRAPSSSDYAGTTYYFCSQQCQQDFDRLPSHYVPPPEGEG